MTSLEAFEERHINSTSFTFEREEVSLLSRQILPSLTSFESGTSGRPEQESR